MRFTDILVKKGIIGQGKLAKVITQSEETGIALEKALKAEGVSEDDSLNAKAEISGLAVKKVSPGQNTITDRERWCGWSCAVQGWTSAARNRSFLEVGVV